MTEEKIYLDNRNIRDSEYTGSFVYVPKVEDTRYEDRTTLLEALKIMRVILEEDLKSGSFTSTIRERISEINILIVAQENKTKIEL